MAGTEILIVDSFHPLFLEKLDGAAAPYSYQPHIEAGKIVEELAKGYSTLVVRSKIDVTMEVMLACPGLKLIARGGAGMDNIDEEAAKELGIKCINAGEANAQSVAEHTMGMLLSLLHKINKSDAEVRQKLWLREENRGTELGEKVIGIVGYGNTGSALASKLLPFNVRILVYDKFKKGFGNDQIEEVEMAQIFEQADIVTFHIPLDCHTKFMVNTDYIQLFVRNFFLLNLSRGEIIITSDVVTALQTGKILGFAADVLEDEKLINTGQMDHSWFNKLTKMDRVILTPHVGGWSKESYEKIAVVLADKIIAERLLLLNK